MTTTRPLKPMMFETEPSGPVTTRSLRISGTKADWVEMAVKQTEPTTSFATTGLVGLLCKLTNHWQLVPEINMALVKRVPVLRIAFVRKGDVPNVVEKWRFSCRESQVIRGETRNQKPGEP